MAEEGGAGDSQSANRARVLAVLGAIATGVGVVGFVTVVGGAVLWIRFNAVAVRPRRRSRRYRAASWPGRAGERCCHTSASRSSSCSRLPVRRGQHRADGAGDGYQERWTRDGRRRPVAPTTAIATSPEQSSLSPMAIEAIAATEAVTKAADAADAAADLGSTVLATQHRDQAQAELDRAQSFTAQADGSLKDASIAPAELTAQANAALERANAALTGPDERELGVRVRAGDRRGRAAGRAGDGARGAGRRAALRAPLAAGAHRRAVAGARGHRRLAHARLRAVRRRAVCCGCCSAPRARCLSYVGPPKLQPIHCRKGRPGYDGLLTSPRPANACTSRASTRSACSTASPS